MKPLFVLISSFLVTLLILKLSRGRIDYALAGRIAMAVMLVFTATGHFFFTRGMTAMVPGFLPAKTTIVYLTGGLEILSAIGLLIPGYKTFIGWMLILFFLLVLPANIRAAIGHINYQTGGTDGNGPGYLWFRIPFQALLMAWVFFSAIRR